MPPARRDLFGRAASWTIRVTGGRWGFLIAFGIILGWAVTGPVFGFSQLWQLVINTGTSIVTFLMVFLIQNAQNRESKAVHLKLDELIRAVTTARNEMIDIECLTEDQIDRLAERYRKLASHHHKKLEVQLGERLVTVQHEVDDVGEELGQVEDRVGHVEERVNRVADELGGGTSEDPAEGDQPSERA